MRFLTVQWSCSRGVVPMFNPSMAAAFPNDTVFLKFVNCCRICRIESGYIGVDHSRLRMRGIIREHKIDGGSTGIDGSIQVEPAALNPNICSHRPSRTYWQASAAVDCVRSVRAHTRAVLTASPFLSAQSGVPVAEGQQVANG